MRHASDARYVRALLGTAIVVCGWALAMTSLAVADDAPEVLTRVTRVTVDAVTDDTAEVTVAMKGAAEPQLFRLADPERLVLDLADATIDAAIAGQAGPLRSVAGRQYADGDKHLARIEMELDRDAEFEMIRRDGVLYLFVGPQAAEQVAKLDAPQAAAPATAPADETIAPADELAQILSQPAAPPSDAAREAADGSALSPGEWTEEDVDAKVDALLAEAPLIAQASGSKDVSISTGNDDINRPQKIYTGTPTNYDLKDIDIVDFLREISETSGYNIVVDPEVSGRVTIKMVDVPWDQVLDVVLKNNGLATEINGNIMRVAPVEKLKKEEEQRLALLEAKRLAVPLETKIFYLSYANPTDLKKVIERQLSKRGEIIIDKRTNAIILSDIPSAMRKVEQLITELDVRTRQVVIQAQIVQTSKDFTRSLGVSWGIGFNMDPAHGNTTGYRFPGIVLGEGGFGSDTGDPDVSNLGAVLLPSGTNLQFGFADILDTFRVYAALSASETEGVTKVLSNPRISTADNKQATISSGTQIPYEVLTRDGPKVVFKNAYTTLRVTPHITFDNHITLDVFVSKDSPRNLGTDVIGIDTNQAETNVLVKDGETLVIGGLNQSSADDKDSKTPWLGDVPFLGWLFKANTIQNQFNDLLIFLTPSIMDDEAVALKTSGIN